MKKTRLFHLLFLSVFLLSMFSFTSERRVITVVFNREMTKNDLLSLQKNLREKNITLVFNRIKFTKNKLSYIDFSIDFGDGFSGSSKAQIRRNKDFGFLRDYNENAEQPFVVGDLR